MKRFHGTIEYLPGQRAAIVALTDARDARGRCFGAERVTLPRAKRRLARRRGVAELVEVALATIHGGVLDTFKEIK